MLFFPPIGLNDGSTKYFAEHGTSVFCQVQSIATSTPTSPEVHNNVRLSELDRQVMKGRGTSRMLSRSSIKITEITAPICDRTWIPFSRVV